MAIVDRNTVKLLSNMRHNAHAGHQSSRPLSEDYEYVGLAGEIAFSQAYGFPIDLRLISDGDNGIDFTTPAGTVDVKTARKAYNLIIEQGKVFADIYVLAQYNNHTMSAALIGWEWGENIKKWEVKDFGYGIINHYRSAKSLKCMSDFKYILQNEMAEQGRMGMVVDMQGEFI